MAYFFTLKQVVISMSIGRSLFAMLVVLSPCLQFAHPTSWIRNFHENEHCSHSLTFKAHKIFNFTHCMRLLIQYECAFYHWNPIYVRSMTSWHAGFLLPFPTVCFFFSCSLSSNVYNNNWWNDILISGRKHIRFNDWNWVY